MEFTVLLVPTSVCRETASMKIGGISPEMELSQRIYGCGLIQKAGILLELRVVTIASAQTILHRFFYRRSLTQFDIRRVASASLYLGCKLEEDPRRVRDVVNVFHYLQSMEDAPQKEGEGTKHTFHPLDPNSQSFKNFREGIIRVERYILREVGFRVSEILVHPHRFILQYIKALLGTELQLEQRNELSQLAWGYINDSLRTTLCCRVQPEVIAVGSIYMAACDLNINLPKSSRWYEIFGVEWDDVKEVCHTLKALYRLPMPTYVKLVSRQAPLQGSATDQTPAKSTS
eukprot:GHVQ01013225.1.p1 GENE.GHVQ01013225.1~~GHVQ01013225.1.p1  ORF type:complete len:288 (+),score=14.32 GHVQ01013225.1:517-1380(+)